MSLPINSLSLCLYFAFQQVNLEDINRAFITDNLNYLFLNPRIHDTKTLYGILSKIIISKSYKIYLL